MAVAIPVTSGNTFTIDWFVDLDNSLTSSDLAATSTWTVTSYSSTSIVLDIYIKNTTLLEVGKLDEAALVSFGFGVGNDANTDLSNVVLTSPGTVFDRIGEGKGKNKTFPGGFKGIDVCLMSTGCSGGDIKEGLQAGASDLLQLELTGRYECCN